MQYFLSTYYVLVSILDTEDLAENKKDQVSVLLHWHSSGSI